jgi:hypothetical protein
MISSQTREKWQSQIDYLEDLGWQECSDWELSFLDVVSTFMSQGRDLTFKQSMKLGEIHKRIETKLG